MMGYHALRPRFSPMTTFFYLVNEVTFRWGNGNVLIEVMIGFGWLRFVLKRVKVRYTGFGRGGGFQDADRNEPG